jgi:hypothetical protein
MNESQSEHDLKEMSTKLLVTVGTVAFKKDFLIYSVFKVII